MNWDALWTEAQPVPLHAVLALGALGLGAYQLIASKGGTRHRMVGYLWVFLMILVAGTGLFIHELRWFGPFSLIHLLILWTTFSLWQGVSAARRGDIERHKREMRSLYIFALLIAGAFTLLPGRVLNAVVFGT